MLSGETAVGKHPVETVRRMAAIIKEVEASDILQQKARSLEPDKRVFSSAIARAAVAASQNFGIETIAVYTESGHSAELMSANRPLALNFINTGRICIAYVISIFSISASCETKKLKVVLAGKRGVVSK